MTSNTELNDLVCDRLDRRSLVKCALINKQWYKAAMPFLFKDIPDLKTQRQKESFRRLVLEEYHWKEEHEQRKEKTERKEESQKKEGAQRKTAAQRKQQYRRQKQGQKQRSQKNQQHLSNAGRSAPGPLVAAKSSEETQDQVDQSTKTGDTNQSQPQQVEKPTRSLLARYGPCIRTIPDVVDLFLLLLRQQPQPGSLPEASDMPPVFEFLACFLSRCTSLLIPKLELNEDHVRLPQLFKLIVMHIVPVAQHLVIGRFDDERHKPDGKVVSETIEETVMYYMFLHILLARTTRILETLSIDMAANWITKVVDFSDSDHELIGFSGNLPIVKELRIITTGGNEESIACWCWLWTRIAPHLDRLFISDNAHPEFVDFLATCLSTEMKQLQDIHLGRKCKSVSRDKKVHFRDPDIGELLDAGPRFKSIYLDMTARPGFATILTLPRHYSTLTEFTMEIGTSDDSFLVHVLAFSPNLRKFVTIQDGQYPIGDSSYFPKVDADVFADMDPRTKTHLPWACEATLEILHVKIVDIPAEYDDHDKVRSQLQKQVYGRLARLTKLQVLQLGHEVEYRDEIGYTSGVVGDPQEECLDLTLESGLGVLNTLKKLRQLNVEWMYHHIDDEDFKWMVNNWPELETVRGIDCEDDYPHLMGESVL
ncbi:hypothetical protein BGZ93_005154 [Podila epicladia]|nr:hypothetical protein BGZ92_001030 [Podila epicladia]KAG0095972.1 hypothetical protein BGZ93_005154 [Podila epicladia]